MKRHIVCPCDATIDSSKSNMGEDQEAHSVRSGSCPQLEHHSLPEHAFQAFFTSPPWLVYCVPYGLYEGPLPAGYAGGRKGGTKWQDI